MCTHTLTSSFTKSSLFALIRLHTILLLLLQNERIESLSVLFFYFILNLMCVKISKTTCFLIRYCCTLVIIFGKKNYFIGKKQLFCWMRKWHEHRIENEFLKILFLGVDFVVKLVLYAIFVCCRFNPLKNTFFPISSFCIIFLCFSTRASI